MVKRVYAHLGEVRHRSDLVDNGWSSTWIGSAIGSSAWVWRGRLLLGTLLGAGVLRARKTPTARKCYRGLSFQRAGDRTRTGDVQLGKLAFYH
jgi:hypothetical protein